MRNVIEDLRKSFLFSFYVAGLLLMNACSSSDYDDSALVNRVDTLENRVQKLEEICRKMNANISSLQILVAVLQDNDWITATIPIKQGDEILGYTISFAKNESITIFNGKNGINGSNGINGKDGKDGDAPIIGVKQYMDGIYYWTIDGEWLINETGSKIQAQGVNGMDGNDGEDGVNGENGKDAITPLLMIENDYWHVSYDSGNSWKQLGKASGECDHNMFEDIKVDKDKVTFILKNGEEFQISKFSSLFDITIDVKKEGTLGNLLTKVQKQNVTSLKIIGNLNDADLRVVYSLHYLEKLDLSDSNIGNGLGNKLFPNTCIKEIIFSKSNIGIEHYLSVHDMYSLEKIVVFTDSLLLGIDDDTLPVINTLTYSEGVTVVPQSQRMLYPFKDIIFPSTLKRLSGKTIRDLRPEVNIVCNASVPPVIGDWVSHEVTSGMQVRWETTYDPTDDNYMTDLFPSYTVIVPKGCVELYKQTVGWRKMKIVESE